MSSDFKWNPQRSKVAIALAQGLTQKEIAAEFSITDRTIRLWLAEEEFKEEVDRLSLMVGISSRAERLRIAQRVIRQKVKEDADITTEKDLLEWLKFAQGETDGIKLNLDAAFTEAAASLARGRQTGTPAEARQKQK